jgi:vesicle-fusing ATPase
VTTGGKANGINKVFDDAYKSKSSLIVIDNIERLIEFVQAGPDFNNSILQTLMTLIQKIPQNPECRLLLVGTTSNFPAMNLVDLDKVFSLKLQIPLLNEKECKDVLGCDIGIKDQPIRKLVQFKETVQGQPTGIWKTKWNVYQ